MNMVLYRSVNMVLEKNVKCHTTLLNGSNVSYDQVGTGKSIVFVHGACENSSFWNHQKILSDRFKIVTIDLSWAR